MKPPVIGVPLPFISYGGSALVVGFDETELVYLDLGVLQSQPLTIGFASDGDEDLGVSFI